MSVSQRKAPVGGWPLPGKIKVLYETSGGPGGWQRAVDHGQRLANARQADTFVDYRPAHYTWVVWSWAHHAGPRVINLAEVTDLHGRYGLTSVRSAAKSRRSRSGSSRDMEAEADRLWQEANRPASGSRRGSKRHGNAPSTGRPGRAVGNTYSGSDIARMHDDFQNRGAATIKGVHFEVREAPEPGPYARKGARGVGGRRYTNWMLLVDGRRVWSGEATDIDPLNIAGGALEAQVVNALALAGFRHERDTA